MIMLSIQNVLSLCIMLKRQQTDFSTHLTSIWLPPGLKWPGVVNLVPNMNWGGRSNNGEMGSGQ